MGKEWFALKLADPPKWWQWRKRRAAIKWLKEVNRIIAVNFKEETAIQLRHDLAVYGTAFAFIDKRGKVERVGHKEIRP